MIKKRLAKHTRKYRHSRFARWLRKYEYRHTTRAAIAIILFIVLFDSAIVQASLHRIHDLGFLGIFIGGAMFTSLLTTAPGIAILVSFLDAHSPLTIAIVGAFGSVLGDWIILKVFEEKIGYELTPLIKKFNLRGFFWRLQRRKERERTMLLGMIAVASPLPDEIGLGLLGIAHLPTKSLLIITYLLNAAGILLLLYGVQLV